MNRIILAFGVFVAVVKYCDGQLGGESLYTKRYERLDIDTILASPRLVTNYVECLLNRKPCPPEGKDLKRILPEALRTKCGRCWPSQKEGAIKVITKLYYDYPKQYLALRERWDSTGEYHRRFEEYLRDHQFNVISGNGLEADINRGDQSQITVRVSRPNGQDIPRRPEPVTPQFQATTSRVSDFDLTQRPTRQDANTIPVARDEQPSFIANRFADDPTEFVNTATRRIVPQSPAQTSSPIAPTSTSRPPQMATVNYRIGIPDPTYTTYTKVTTINSRNPILNLINRLTLKFSNTAEFLAGMLRNTVKQPKRQVYFQKYPSSKIITTSPNWNKYYSFYPS